jgi:RimJ/RimL family protein N-acetyltransferase
VRLVLDRDQGADPLASVPEPRSACLEVVVRPGCRRRGYGWEGARLALSLGFEDLGLHRVWGLRDAGDRDSARLMDRLGMARERVIRHHVFSGGAWRDSVVYSILRHEWDMTRLARSGSAARAAG